MNPPAWHENAACRNHPEPDLWHSDRTGVPGRRIDNQAKAICRTCPVIDTCRTENMWAIHGVWGGLTADERAEIRRRTSERREYARGA